MTSLLGCGWGAHRDGLPLFGFSGEDDPDILEVPVVDDVVNGDPVVLQELTGGFLLIGRVGAGDNVNHAILVELEVFLVRPRRVLLQIGGRGARRELETNLQLK